MDMPIQQMTVDSFARLQAAQGANVVSKQGLHWRQVRRLFYRPLLAHEDVDDANLEPPCRWPGAYQYTLKRDDRANSAMAFLVYDEPHSYSLADLNRHRQKQIKKAANDFRVRPITDPGEIKERAYAAYLSFYRRTHYKYKSERTEKEEFDRWADIFRHFPQTILLGAEAADALAAVSVAYWVNQTLIYASIFSETEAMRKNVASLLLHELRLLAARQPGINQILARPYQGGNSLDRFYLDRECKLVRKPARLVANPGVVFLLRRLFPMHYAKLCGTFDATIPSATLESPKS